MAEATIKKATGSGTVANISNDGTAFKKLASVTKISPPNMTRGTVDVTDLNSFGDNDQMKEYLTDFIEAEDMTIEGFVKDGDEGLPVAENLFYSGKTAYIQIVLPEAIGKTMLVTGLLTGYKPIGDISSDAGIAYSFTVKPNKKPTLSDTAGT